MSGVALHTRVSTALRVVWLLVLVTQVLLIEHSCLAYADVLLVAIPMEPNVAWLATAHHALGILHRQLSWLLALSLVGACLLTALTSLSWRVNRHSMWPWPLLELALALVLAGTGVVATVMSRSRASNLEAAVDAMKFTSRQSTPSLNAWFALVAKQVSVAQTTDVHSHLVVIQTVILVWLFWSWKAREDVTPG